MLDIVGEVLQVLNFVAVLVVGYGVFVKKKAGVQPGEEVVDKGIAAMVAALTRAQQASAPAPAAADETFVQWVQKNHPESMADIGALHTKATALPSTMSYADIWIVITTQKG